jgi:hypothetical protein
MCAVEEFSTIYNLPSAIVMKKGFSTWGSLATNSPGAGLAANARLATITSHRNPKGVFRSFMPNLLCDGILLIRIFFFTLRALSVR